MKVASKWAVAAWLVLVIACSIVVARASFTTDISAFLPRSPTPGQQILVEQLRDGVVSRLILIGLEGGSPAKLAQASRQLAATLRQDGNFVAVGNGDDAVAPRDRDYLWRNRYLLSPAVTPERFSVVGLRSRLEENLGLLASPAGPLVRRMLPSDPTSELLEIVEQLEGQSRPASRNGVWFSPDGGRALLVAQTRAAGYDIDAQERALAAIRAAFARTGGESGFTLRMSGPGVFSVASRASIKGDALRFSLIATVLISLMTLAFYRSPRVLALSLLPVATGAIAGVAAVSLGFGAVHGITLGFGVTLIGEGVDYAIFLFTRARKDVPPHQVLDRVWPTLRLGVLTSICGFSAMLFSGFSGLAQLGLFSVTGLVVAAVVTRWVLPHLMPAGFSATAVTTLAPVAMAALHAARRWRYLLLVAVMMAAAFLALQRGPLWSDELSNLSPVSQADQALDRQMRKDIGAPDVRHLVVIGAPDEESALQASERAVEVLRDALRKGWLEGHDAPSLYLPSRQAQRARQAALADIPDLRGNLRQALEGLPYRSEIFEPFLKDVREAATMRLLDRTSLEGTNFALKLDTLLVRRGDGWAAMLPLRGVSDVAAIARGVEGLPGARALLLDLKGESDRLYAGYRREALAHSLAGAAAIVVLLYAGLRSGRRVVAVLAPLVVAVLVTTAVLSAFGQLSIFHLVGLLLVVAVGSNYSLFFDRQIEPGPETERTVVSLLFACVSTIIGFGLLSFSSVPVLHAIGAAVGLGAALALACAAALSRAKASA